ncbi:pickpocket protein 28-like [Procambarus clarkii]|uniref:pickpocket protein 28-like n=1 Tax=Procambarus clarkii TaxID=6728 RepID=UPI003743B291
MADHSLTTLLAYFVQILFWVVSWVMSLTACCYYIGQNLTEYRSAPTLTSIDSTNYPISKVDFPSVTFCNFNHIVKSRRPPRQEDVLGRVKYKEDQWATMTFGVYQNLFSVEPLWELVNSSVLLLDNREVYCTIKESSQRCEEMVLFCLWRGTIDCAGLFTQVSTRNGFCCVINVANSLTKPNMTDLCPGERRVRNHTDGTRLRDIIPDLSSAGINQGLTVLLDAQVYEYTYSTYHSVGFKMHLQEPSGAPGLNHEGVVMSPGKEAFIPIQAHSTFTTPAALQLRPDQRKCFLNSERKLKVYTGVYSHEACVMEHRTTMLLEACGCREYYITAGEGKVCLSQDEIACVRKFVGVESYMSMFADDAKLMRRVVTDENCRLLQEDLDRLQKWPEKFNTSKCKVMEIGSEAWHLNDIHSESVSDSCYSGCNSTTYMATPSYASLPSPNMEKTWLGLRFLMPTVDTMCRLGFLDELN